MKYMIKIRGGKYLHRQLKQPPLEITRSTKDVCKEGMFNSLGNIYDLSFLDLFGGSGSIGIEAYSRGANPVYINEKNTVPSKIIKENLETLKITDINLTNMDYLDCLNYYSKKGITFDIIFLDPPYKMIIDNDFISKVLSFNVAHKNTILIVETDYELDDKIFENFKVKILKYGRSKINFLRNIE